MIIDEISLIEWFILDINKTVELEKNLPLEISQSTIQIMAKEKVESLIKYLGGNYVE